MCVLCELPKGRVNEWIYGNPTGSQGFAVINWRGQGNIDKIIGVFRNTHLTKATTEPNGHGAYATEFADRYFDEMYPILEREGYKEYGSGSWAYILHNPEYEGGYGKPYAYSSISDIELIPGVDGKTIGRGKQRRLDHLTTKIEAPGHWYVQLIESGSNDW